MFVVDLFFYSIYFYLTSSYHTRFILQQSSSILVPVAAKADVQQATRK